MRVDYFTSDLFEKLLNRKNTESIRNLIVKIKQQIAFYNDRGKYPIIDKVSIDQFIHMLVDFRNKIFTKSMFILLYWSEDEIDEVEEPEKVFAQLED